MQHSNLHDGPTAKQDRCLMVHGRIRTTPSGELVEVRRGMQLVTLDGKAIGVVAAVVVDCQRQTPTDLLLCQVSVSADYRLVPISLITQVTTEIVYLTIDTDDIDKLTSHQSQ